MTVTGGKCFEFFLDFQNECSTMGTRKAPARVRTHWLSAFFISAYNTGHMTVEGYIKKTMKAARP